MQTPISARAIAVVAFVWLAGPARPPAQGGPPAETARAQGEDQDAARGVAAVRVMVEDAQWGEALRSARALAGRFPGRLELHILVGDAFLLNFQAREAVAEYRAAMASPKVAALALGKLAVALVALGEDAEALAAIHGAAAAGIAPSDGSLVLQARLEPDPKDRAGILKRLVAAQPEDRVLPGQLALAEALATRLAGQPDEPPAGFGSTKVKEIYHEPSVRANLNGREEWLALDTGSESILLNEDTASGLRLPVLAETEYVGWGFRGPRKSRYVFVERLEVAGRTLHGIPAILNRRDSEFWTNKAGYLSLGPFRDALVRYDRRRGVFSLHPSGTDPAPLLGGAPTALPVLWAKDLPLVPVMIQGKGPFPFLLDTGAVYTLLDTKHAETLGIRINTGRYGKIRAEGMSGSFTSGMAEQVSLGVGNTRFERPVILVTDVPQRFPVPVFGILGRDILNDYAMAFDGPLARVALLRYPN